MENKIPVMIGAILGRCFSASDTIFFGQNRILKKRIRKANTTKATEIVSSHLFDCCLFVFSMIYLPMSISDSST